MTCRFCGMNIALVGDATYFTYEMVNGFYSVCKARAGVFRNHEPVSYVKDLVEVLFS